MGHDVEMLPASDYLAMMKQAIRFRRAGRRNRLERTGRQDDHPQSSHQRVGRQRRTRHYLSLGYSGDQGIFRRTDQGILNLRANFGARSARTA